MSPRPRPLRVALTGGIATGKSHCLEQFIALGAPAVDADALAHQVIAPETEGAAEVVKQFGTADRKSLGAIVFRDASKRAALEAIIHPRVFAGVEAFFRGLKAASPFGIADIPLLFETRHEKDFDRVIVTHCREQQQRARLVARGLSEADATARIAAQMPFDHKMSAARLANVPVDVIDTSGSIDDTNRQVRRIADILGSLPPRVCT